VALVVPPAGTGGGDTPRACTDVDETYVECTGTVAAKPQCGQAACLPANSSSTSIGRPQPEQ
jgi:hypothetical protein